jgi:two-component system sensor histidine kinase AtoS
VVLHEIRNVLSSLELNVYSLEQQLKHLGPNVGATVQDLSEFAHHLSAVVGSGQTLLGENMQVGDVEKAVLAAVTMTGRRSHHEVSVHVEAGLRPVALPTHQLAQILLNTTLNAVHAGATSIRISAIALQGRVHISVLDDGAGMTASDLSQALEPGFTTKASGTGLGLAICREILEPIGGSIGLASQFGEGTTVVVELPFGVTV